MVPTTICLAGAAVLNATEAASSRDTHRIAALRIDEAPTIDGRLDEAVWQDAPVVEQFTQQEPLEGEAATERTEVRMLYDSSNLYIGVRAFDSDPEGIIATEMRRDSQQMLNEDNFQFIIDTFNDSRSGYMFATNPLGAKLEQQIFEEGEGSGFFGPNSNINIDWDGVWNVRSRRTEAGWVAEIAIPMRTLRFIPGESQSWGINFMRLIRRKNESVFWAPIPKAYSLTRVSLAGSLDGLEALSQGVDLRIKPFVVAGGEGERVDGEIEGSGLGEVGLDMTYGVTSGLNLDVTVNTDFAQVEVDEQQVNLTRFSLFFPEKRDFFLENAGLSTVGALTPRLKTADLFFSRRVGLSDRGQPVPIIAGGR
ncbi:MAG TPA: hydrolase, partial [Acidobacteria bacterium]|nr:hydrolase [Acidobacteriota bacterium]